MLKDVNCSLYNKGGNKKLNIVLNVLIAIVAVVLLCEIVFVTNYTGVYVVDKSMQPTLYGATTKNDPGGDYVYLIKGAKPTYGDIVVVERKNGDPLIKRVIALGGDTIRLESGKLSIKYKGTDVFKDKEEKYVLPENNKDVRKNTFPKENTEGGFFVEEGKVFLMGDNRDVSNDSRDLGVFDQSAIYGVVTGWSVKHKEFFTAVHNFFTFELPKGCSK